MKYLKEFAKNDQTSSGTKEFLDIWYCPEVWEQEGKEEIM